MIARLCIIVFLITPLSLLSMNEKSPRSMESSSGKKNASEKRLLYNNRQSSAKIKKHPLDIASLDLDNDHNKIGNQKNTPLIFAAQHDQLNSVKKLLAYSTLNVNHQNKWGNTALHCATIAQNHLIIYELLKDPRIDASLHNKEQQQAHEFLKEIMQDSATIKIMFYKNIILHTPKYTTIDYFTKNKLTDPLRMAVDKDGTTPLIWAICTNQKKSLIRKIVSNLSHDINHADHLFGTALHYAVLLDLPEIINILLLSPRTDPSAQNKEKLYPHNYIIQEPCTDTKCNNKPYSHHKKYTAIRLLLFSRMWLNTIIRETTFETIMTKGATECVTEFHINDRTLTRIVALIKKHAENEKYRQSAELPEHACLPKYATDDFLKNMIQYHYIKHYIL